MQQRAANIAESTFLSERAVNEEPHSQKPVGEFNARNSSVEHLQKTATNFAKRTSRICYIAVAALLPSFSSFPCDETLAQRQRTMGDLPFQSQDSLMIGTQHRVCSGGLCLGGGGGSICNNRSVTAVKGVKVGDVL